MVGAVIVKQGRVVGEGYHRAAGLDHAEVVALRRAGDKARGATIYVTLEPCCHTGRTGPCTEAIMAAGIRRVVYAVDDPDGRVNCCGGKCLRLGGLEIVKGILREEALRLNEVYFGYHRLGRPYVTLKMALTLDGRIATRTGDSQWISGPEALKVAHQLRAEADAVVVGRGTVAADNPALTVRMAKGTNPYRIVLTSSIRFPRQCQLLDDNDDYRTIVATSNESAQRLARRKRGRGVIIWNVKTDRKGHLRLDDFLAKAGAFGFRSILVEGGATLATSFLNAGLVDKYIQVVAPKIIGRGIEAVGDLKIRKLANAIQLVDGTFENLGADCLFTGYVRRDA
jgi:diaminohydroxyphosphoribosylaminopyrimidine deaminase/5-amino-6-(5-phosphoribosylamino)uracil reductase